MGIGMTIWYIFGFIISASFATLMIMVQIRLKREQKETREKAIIQAEKEAKAGSYARILRDEFRDIRIANMTDYARRIDLLNLSTAIQFLNRGELVEKSTLIFVLSRLKGTEKAIERIKGAGN